MNSKTIIYCTAFHPGASGIIGAGELISKQNVKSLLAQGHRIHILAISPKTQQRDEELAELCDSYTTITHSRMDSIRAIFYSAYKGALLAPWLYSRVTKKNTLIVQTLIKTLNADAIYYDFPSTLGFVNYIQHASFYYFAHDLISQKVSRIPLLNYFKTKVTSIEGDLLKHAKGITTLSEKDKNICTQMDYKGPVSIFEIKEGAGFGKVDHDYLVKDILAEFRGHKNIVFFGNMNRPENHWSIILFIVKYFWKITVKHKDAKLWVMGLSPRWLLRIIAKILPNIKVTGAVDNPGLAFSNAHICIAPIVMGAGVKIKVLQMLNAGATVISTPIGSEGIPSQNNLITTSLQSFPSKINTLLDRPPFL